MKMYEKDYQELKDRVMRLEAEIKFLANELLSFSLQEVDFTTGKKLCELYYRSMSSDLKYISIICAGHIARVYGELIDKEIILEIKQIAHDPKHRYFEAAKIALEDISYTDP